MNKNVAYKIGKQLKELRILRYLEDSERYAYCRNQDTFSEIMECTRETIVKWENDRGTPTLKDFKKICDILNCEPHYLFGINNEISRNVDSISKATGLSNRVIDRLLEDDFLTQLINHLLESKNATIIIRNIYQVVNAEKDAAKILNATYTGMFITRIKGIFINAITENFFKNDGKGKYTKWLQQELEFDYYEMLNAMEKHDGIMDNYNALVKYIMDCMTEQGFAMFCEKYIEYDFETVEKYFECFINDVAEQTYDIFMYYQTKDIWIGQIMQEISKNIFDFKYEV